jgi:hypothetical protein
MISFSTLFNVPYAMYVDQRCGSSRHIVHWVAFILLSHPNSMEIFETAAVMQAL